MGATVAYVFNSVFYLVFQLAAKLLSLLVQWLNFAINFRLDPSIAVISQTWTIVRDFSNMFFIVIMIIMAFAMIFKVRWLEGYDPGHLMVQFVVAALLINFSLVLCGLVITGTQSLNAIFITAIGDFADRMGQFLNPSQWLNTPAKDLTTSPQLFFSAILLFVVDFSMLVALIFSIIRIPFLWLLMILSPLALLLSILPNTRPAFKNWTEQFIRWNFFLPIFLSVLYIGMILLSQQDKVMTSVIVTATNNPNNPVGAGIALGAGLDITIQTLFFYALVALVFIGGTNAAIKGSLVAGVGAVAGAQWAKNWALRNTGVGAFGTAGRKKWEEIQKEGLTAFGRKLPFGGPPVGEKFAERAFGVQNARVRQQKDFIDTMNKESTRLKDEEVAGRLKIDQSFMDETKDIAASTPEGAARRAILYERGMMTNEEFAEDIDTWTKTNPFLAEAMVDKAKKGKFKKVKGDQLLEMAAAEGDFAELGKRAGANVTRRKLFEAIGENDDALKKMTSAQLQQATDLMGGKDSNDTNEFVKTVAKKRPDIAAEYKGIVKGINVRNPVILSALIYKEIANKQPKDLAEMLETTWRRPEFVSALNLKYRHLQMRSRPSTGGVQIPGIPAGLTFIPPGNPTPAGAPAPLFRVSGGDIYPPGSLTFFPGVRGAKELLPVQPATTTTDAIYDDDKNTNRALANIPRARRVKENPGGGEVFKTALERTVSNSPIKLAAARSIRP